MQNIGWETEKQELCHIFKERLLANRMQITFGELSQINLPSFFRSYLKSQAKRFFEQENPLHLDNSTRFDLATDEVQKGLAALNEALQRSTLFTEVEISDAVDRTLSLQIDFFVKPRTTLERVFFKSIESRSQKELLQAILGISDNRIFIQELIKRLKTISQPVISKDEFSRLAREVETEVYRRDAISFFLQDITAILEFLAVIEPQKDLMLKPALLPELLRERNLTELAQKVQWQLPHFSHEKLVLVEIEKLLRKSEAPKEPVGKPQNSEARKLSSETDWQEAIFSSNAAEDHPFLDFSEKSESNGKSDSGANEKKSPLKGNNVLFSSSRSETIGAREMGPIEPGQKEIPKIQKPRIIYKDEEKGLPKKGGGFGRHAEEKENIVIDRKMIENQPEGPIPSLATIIDPRSRKILIRKIFKKDEVAFNAFIEKMEATVTWKEAKVMIDAELHRRNVDIFCREAIRLGDLIFSRYFPKKR